MAALTPAPNAPSKLQESPVVEWDALAGGNFKSRTVRGQMYEAKRGTGSRLFISARPGVVRWDIELRMTSPHMASTSAARRWRLLQRALRVSVIALLIALMLITFSFDHKHIVQDNRAFIASLRKTTRTNLRFHTQPHGEIEGNKGDAAAAQSGRSIDSPNSGVGAPPAGRSSLPADGGLHGT